MVPSAAFGASVPTYRILLVDDEPAVLAALQMAFEDDSIGFAIRTASSAEQALELLRQQPADLVLTDKNLPRMSGLGLARAITGEHPGTAVILVTGYANGPSRDEGRAIGLAAYVEKPFTNIYDIPRLAREVLGDRRAHA